MRPRDRLARLHCVNTLLHALTGHDLYLADQVLQAIDAASEKENNLESGDLAATLATLHQTLLGTAPEAGFAFCDGNAAEAKAGPLFLRAQLLAAVHRNTSKDRATIMVGNLPGSDATCGRRTRAAQAAAREHAELVASLRDLAVRRANPGSMLTLLFV
ncbi:MAG: hypothetical protein ACREIA_10505 [Opitutaceae bacterium]